MTQENLELPAGFGDPSGSSQKYEVWKFKNTKDNESDELILRVLPMMKSLVQLDDFGLYWSLHYGWNGVNETDPSKKAYHPFLCIEEKNYGMITTACPVCVYRNGFLDKIKAAEADPSKAGMFPQLKAWKDDHGKDGKFRIPCINKQGQFGIFLAPYGIRKQLQEEMKKLRTQTYPGTTVAIKPAGRKGLWFKFTRSGRPSPTSDKVEVNRIQNTDGSEMKDFHIISDEQLQEAVKRIPDLVELKEQNRIRVDQMEALVALDKVGKGSSDPKEVDRILEIGKKKVEQEVVEDVDYTGSVASGSSAVGVATTPAEAPKTEAPKTEAPKAAVAPEPPKEEVKPAAAAENFDDLWK